jgi:hypothetical protein
MKPGGTDYEDNFILHIDSRKPHMLRFPPGVKRGADFGQVGRRKVGKWAG